MNVGEAMKSPNTVLGRAFIAQRERQDQMKYWTPGQRKAFWVNASKATS